MKRYTCIKNILDSFDYYDSVLFCHFGTGKYFRKELIGRSFVIVTTPRTIDRIHAMSLLPYHLKWTVAEEEQREAFARIFRAYTFRSVREGREGGLDYLTICYALCRKLSDACKSALSEPKTLLSPSRVISSPNEADTDSEWAVKRGMARFSMRAYVQLQAGHEDFGRVHCMESPLDTSTKEKLAFLRRERQLRESNQSETHIRFLEA